jgi:Cbb3-type cytochrome oxidase, cytochrome c subunit
MALAGVVMIGVIGLTFVGATSSPAGIATVPPVAGMTAQQLEGLKIYNAEGCSSCHALRGIGGSSGPDLSRAGFRWEADTIRSQIVTPKDARMPAFDGLTTQQIDDLVSFLTSLK